MARKRVVVDKAYFKNLQMKACIVDEVFDRHYVTFTSEHIKRATSAHTQFARGRLSEVEGHEPYIEPKK